MLVIFFLFLWVICSSWGSMRFAHNFPTKKYSSQRIYLEDVSGKVIKLKFLIQLRAYRDHIYSLSSRVINWLSIIPVKLSTSVYVEPPDTNTTQIF